MSESHSLKITKVFNNVSRETLFEAWTHKENMVHWMGPGEVTCEKVEIDLTEGGEYQIFMKTPDGPMTAYGKYKNIDPPNTLSFTWGWRQNDLEGTLVTLTFKEVAEGTELTLEHTGFPQKEFAQHHEMGWTSIIEKCIDFLK